jgi:exodeoxyribonuclease V alpha subunit
LDLINDMQVVCAVNEKSPLSRQALNKMLQAMLNHQPGEVSRAGFRAGDKVVCVKNGFYKSIEGSSWVTVAMSEQVDSNSRDEVYVANGELGKVAECDEKGMVIKLDSPARTIQVYFGAEGGCTFELGYALSVHKSQGSDWPWVIVILDEYPGAKMVCDRSWLYTAISRAKSKCWMVGKRQTANRMCKTSKIWHRKTFLKERILAEKSRRRLADV